MLSKVLNVHSNSKSEKVAVIPRKKIFNGNYWTGFKKMDENSLFKLLIENLIFKKRSEKLEKDESYKQIIPYFIVKKNNYFFASKRKTAGTDKRAHGYDLIGFGGHLRKKDIKGQMKDWLKREFDEEIYAEKINNINFYGVVNDDSDAVSGIGKVHFGLVFIVNVLGKVYLKEKNKFQTGKFYSTFQLKRKMGNMESWSKIIIESL